MFISSIVDFDRRMSQIPHSYKVLPFGVPETYTVKCERCGNKFKYTKENVMTENDPILPIVCPQIGCGQIVDIQLFFTNEKQ